MQALYQSKLSERRGKFISGNWMNTKGNLAVQAE